MPRTEDARRETVEFNVSNEQVIVASILRDPAARARWAVDLKATDFVGARHRTLATVAALLHRDNLEYAEDTVELLAGGADYGGVEYLRKLLTAYETNPNLELHVAKLRRDTARHTALTGPVARLRELLETGGSPDDAIETALAETRRVFRPDAAAGPEYGSKLIARYLADLRSRPGLYPLYFKALDEHLTEGTAPKRVIVVAGRPSMGKSTVCGNMVLRQALRKRRCLVLPVERGTDTLVDGMICARARLDLDHLLRHGTELTAEEQGRVEKAAADIFSDEYIHVWDRRLSLDELELLLVEGDYEIVYLDLFEKFLKNLDAGRIAEALNRVQEMAQRARRGRGACLILYHQIRRGTASAKDHRPNMEMLKNSGAYEEVADLIFLLHREKYYDPTLDRDVIEFLCVKQTRGTAGWSEAFEFEGSISRVGAHVPNWREELDALLV